MRSGLSREKRLHKVPDNLEHDESEPSYCLRSFKRHKVTAAIPQFHTDIGAIAGELQGTCNAAGVTTGETTCENLMARPTDLPDKMSPIESKSGSMKPTVLQCKTSSMNVEMESLRVPEKVELHNAGNNSFVPKHIDITTSMPPVFPRKHPTPKIRKGVTIFREFPQGCGRRKPELFSKFDLKISEEKQMMFEAEKEQIRGGYSNAGCEFARNAERKILEDIDNKVRVESEIATRSNSLQANLSPAMTSNNNDGVKSWMERNGNDGVKSWMHLANNEYVDMAHSYGSKSVGQQGVKTSEFAAATDGYNDKTYELMGYKGFYYLLLKQNDTKFNDGSNDNKSNDGESATPVGVTTSDYEAAGATDGFHDKTYELMGYKGFYYLLLKHNDTKSNDGNNNTKSNDGESATRMGATTSYYEAAGATDKCNDKVYELMGHKGFYYLLLKNDGTNIHVPYVEADNVEAGIHNAETVSDWKDNNGYSGKPSNNLNVNDNQEALCRGKVRKVLNLFKKTLKEQLLEKQETRKSKGKTKMISSHIYEEVAMLLKQQKEWIYMNERVLGAIPGVEVGDEFQYRAELVIVGVHAQFVANIDYMEKDSKKIATSILSTRCYFDDEELTDVISFCVGGNETMTEQNSKDQTPVQGKFALKNSMDEESPVRVIRGHQSLEGKSTSYTYDGLYIVSKFWRERGQNGQMVHMFQLNKMRGQPRLKINKLGRHGKSKARFYRTLIDDISYGKEKISIPVVNDIDNDKPPTFNYITKMVYPRSRKSANAKGCRCIGGCSDHFQCSCVVKNGGLVPFNEDGALVKAKPFVYECGPSCKCPPSCMNRVSQHGLKFQLEVFKTEMRGWGIRSRNFISSGSFICEYVGELLDDKQAEERIGFDEYLFDIGDEDGFAIDAAKFGNIGRFVNHSCSPNLYAPNVLFDHDDKMMPHVMLFATKNIHPLQELTYDYNYKVDHVSDSNGNVKKKTCHCGARKCRGRMY